MSDMSEEDLKTALEWVRRLSNYVRCMEGNEGRPSLCGLCRRTMKGSNASVRFLRQDIPFETEMHMRCADLLHARECHVILQNMRAPLGARKWLEEEKKKAWEHFKKLRGEFER